MRPLDPFARVLVSVLRHALPAATADDVIGDLVEHYGRRSTWRRLWLMVEAAKLAASLGRSNRIHVVAESPGRRGVPVDIWVRDVRYALRSLFRSRGFAAVALTSLALGVGLTTAVFSVIDGVLLRPLPYGDADAIVRIREVAKGRSPGGDAIPRSVLWIWEESSRTVDAFGPYTVSDARIGADTESFVGIKVEVGARFFDVLRTTPLHGRLPGRADDDRSAPMIAVLSYSFWQRAFAGDPRAIGRVVLIDDRPAAIVGVLPDTFAFPSSDVAVYVPGRWRLPDAPPGVGRAFVGPGLDVLARMRAGVSTSDVVREAAAMSLQARNPPAGSAPLPAPLQVIRLQDDLVKDVRPALVMLIASVACVLAIVCVNLTSLLLARGTVRQREMAVRAALGASRWGMVRPLVLEGVLLALAGGAAGLAVASLLVASLPLTATVDPMFAARVGIDGRVLIFTLAVSGLIGIVVGVLPAWQTPTAHGKGAVFGGHVHVLPGTAVGAEKLRSALVVIQMALAMVLAVGAALLSRSVVTLLTVDLGFRPEHALALQVRLPPGGGAAFDWRARFYEDFLARLSAYPDVRAAGFSTSLPMHETFSQSKVEIDGVAPADAASPFRAHREVVTPGYFAAIGLPVASGRGFTAADTATSERVLVVNETFAASFLASREPVGQRVMVFGDWHRIVGVVKSKRHTGLRSERRSELYVALAQAPPDIVTQSGAGLVLRAAREPAALLPFVRSTLRGLQPQAAIEADVLEDRVWSSTAQPRFYATVMGGFAALALVTALVGLYGVLSYVVERRRVEIGVRRALGATSRDISGLVLGRGLKLVALAIPVGLACSAAAGGLLRNLLFGVEPADPATLAAVVVLVPSVALLACVWPARRATSIAPLDALRED